MSDQASAMTEPRYTIYAPPSPQVLTFPRLLLSQAGQTWVEERWNRLTFASQQHPAQPWTVALHHKPPVLEDRQTGRQISQLPAIVLYLLDTHEIACDRVDAMRLMGDAVDMHHEINTAMNDTHTTNPRAWWRFKYYELQAWMRLHNAWIHTRTRIQAEAALLTALWCPLCDFLPDLWPVMEREAWQLYEIVTRIGAIEEFKPYRQQGEMTDRVYMDVFRDGSLRKMDDEAGPPPDPLHDNLYITYD